MNQEWSENCHGGSGKFYMTNVLKGEDSDIGIAFMHDDVLEPGSVFGEHLHRGNEEVYFVAEGHGTMIYDGKEYPIGPGGVSLVKDGHSHGIRNSTDGQMRLIVLEVRKNTT